MITKKKSKKELLRQKAEKLLSKKSPVPPKIENKDIKRLVHELQVHQVELEMQNDELRRAQAEIEESRSRYSDLYDFSPVGYFTFSHTGEIVEVNLTGASLLGIDRSLLPQRSFSTFVDPGFRSLFRDHRLSVLKNGKKERCELKLIKKNGKSFHASFESIVVPREKGGGTGLTIRSAVSDITELKKAQEKAETEHAFRVAVANSILSGIIAMDLKGRQSYVNLGFCRMVGRTEEELIGRKPPFAYWPPEESDHISRAFQIAMDGKAPRDGIQLRFMRKNGERFDALVLSSPLKDHWGKVIGLISTVGDISHIKEMEKELKQLNTELEERVRQRTAELENVNRHLRQSEEKFRVLADNTYDMETWISPEGQFVFMSPSCKRITGHNAGEFMEDPNLLRRIVHPEDLTAFDRHRQEEEEEEVTHQEFQFRVIHTDGSIHWIGHVCQRIFDEEGHFLGIRGSNRDITKRKQIEEALRESEERLRFVLETCHIGAWDMDIADHTTIRSPEHDRIYGYDVMLPRWTYEMFLEHVLPEDRARVDATYQHAVKTRSNWSFEFRIRRPDGKIRWIWAVGGHKRDPDGEIRRVAGIVQDITERKQMEEDLRKSRNELEIRVQERTAELMEAVEELQDEISDRKRAEEALREASLYNRRLIEASLDPLVTISAEGKVMDANRATELVTGVGREELIGSDFSAYFTDREKAEDGYRQVLAEGLVRDYPLAIHRRSGTVTDVLYNATVYRNEAGEIQGVFAAARDITERKRAEETLRESEARLRYLSSQLLTVQENERKHIAREVHDSLGQSLSAIKFKIESVIAETREGRHEEIVKSLETIVPIIQTSLEESRRIQMNLRPSVLDDLGILPTLDWFCRDYQEIYSHIRIEKETHIKESDLSPELKTVIYRVTQEAMNNIAKHSKANLVRLFLNKNENKIELTIRDNGVGFDLEQVVDREESKRGLGLTSMRERIQLSGGSSVIESTPGQGTTLSAIWTL